MPFYKIVRVKEIIEYVSAENKEKAICPIRDRYVELVNDEKTISETCEEVDEIEVKTYWINKNKGR